MEIKGAVQALAALSQDTRLAVYRLLVQAGPSGMAVGEIGDALGTAPATLSFHLKELVHAGLIAPKQSGRFIFYSANYAQMTALLQFLTDNCCVRDGELCETPSVCTPSKSNTRRSSKAHVTAAVSSTVRTQAKPVR
jgi:ArsR family transcriptional regulator, arsenate/arsenite/antimonite-responsive transcriptional repressor